GVDSVCLTRKAGCRLGHCHDFVKPCDAASQQNPQELVTVAMPARCRQYMESADYCRPRRGIANNLLGQERTVGQLYMQYIKVFFFEQFFNFTAAGGQGSTDIVFVIRQINESA